MLWHFYVMGKNLKMFNHMLFLGVKLYGNWLSNFVSFVQNMKKLILDLKFSNSTPSVIPCCGISENSSAGHILL